MQHTVEQKQAFLRQQVLQQGLDQASFLALMQTKKKQWEDLSLWTIQELNDLVQQFKALRPQPQPQLKPQHPPANTVLDHDFQVVTKEDASKTVAQRSEMLFFDRYRLHQAPFSRSIKVERLQARRQGRGCVYIDRVFSRITSRVFGMLQSQVVVYSIKFPELKWQVERTLADMVWLGNCLKMHYPFTFVPVFKAFKNVPRSKEKAAKHIRRATAFIQALMQDPHIYQSRIFQLFFSLNKEQQFGSFKRNTDALQFLKIANNVPSPTGTHTLRLAASQAVFCQQAQKALSKQAPIMVQLDRQAIQVAAQIQKLSGTIFKLSGLVGQLQQTYSDFNNSIGEGRVQEPCSVLISLNKTLAEWGHQIKSLSQPFSVKLRQMFKRNKEQRQEFIQMLRRRTEAEQQYLKYRSNLQAKKDRLFDLRDMNKWQIPKDLQQVAIKRKAQLLDDRVEAKKFICAGSTQNLSNLRDWYAFMSENTLRGGQQHFRRCTRRLASQLIQFSDQIRHNLHQQKEVVGQIKQIGALMT